VRVQNCAADIARRLISCGRIAPRYSDSRFVGLAAFSLLVSSRCEITEESALDGAAAAQ
jgi:hypothetical protein